jgi:hypothetical protein
MEIQDVVSATGSLGFPIAVTWFLLTKGSVLVTNITTAINDMRFAINEMSTTIKNLGDRLEELEKGRRDA